MYTDITLFPNQIATPVDDLQDLKKIDSFSDVNGAICFVKATAQLYYYDEYSNLASDDLTIIKPYSGFGRWIFLSQSKIFNAIIAGSTAVNCFANHTYYCYGEVEQAINLILPQKFDSGIEIEVINQSFEQSVIVKPYNYNTQTIINGTNTTTNTSDSAVTSLQAGCVMKFKGIVTNTTWFVDVVPQFQSIAANAASFS